MNWTPKFKVGDIIRYKPEAFSEDVDDLYKITMLWDDGYAMYNLTKNEETHEFNEYEHLFELNAVFKKRETLKKEIEILLK